MACQMCNRHDYTCNCNKIKELLNLDTVAIFRNGDKYQILRYFDSRKCLHQSYFEHDGELLLLNWNYCFDFPVYFLNQVKNRWFRLLPDEEIAELRKNGFIQ